MAWTILRPSSGRSSSPGSSAAHLVRRGGPPAQVPWPDHARVHRRRGEDRDRGRARRSQATDFASDVEDRGDHQRDQDDRPSEHHRGRPSALEDQAGLRVLLRAAAAAHTFVLRLVSEMDVATLRAHRLDSITSRGEVIADETTRAKPPFRPRRPPDPSPQPLPGRGPLVIAVRFNISSVLGRLRGRVLILRPGLGLLEASSPAPVPRCPSFTWFPRPEPEPGSDSTSSSETEGGSS